MSDPESQARSGRKNKQRSIRKSKDGQNIVLIVLMKVWDSPVRSVKLYRLDKPGVDWNGTMNKTTGLLAWWASGTDILQALSVHHEITVAMIKNALGPKTSLRP